VVKTTYSKSDNILLSSEIQNKILIAENLTDYDISKAEALGIKELQVQIIYVKIVKFYALKYKKRY